MSGQVADHKLEGASGLEPIKVELARLSTDKALLAQERREVQRDLDEVQRGEIDGAQAAQVIKDIRLIYDLASGAERRELIRLVIKRIAYHGEKITVEVEFFDRDLVNPLGEGSIRTADWLVIQVSYWLTAK